LFPALQGPLPFAGEIPGSSADDMAPLPGDEVSSIATVSEHACSLPAVVLATRKGSLRSYCGVSELQPLLTYAAPLETSMIRSLAGQGSAGGGDDELYGLGAGQQASTGASARATTVGFSVSQELERAVATMQGGGGGLEAADGTWARNGTGHRSGVVNVVLTAVAYGGIEDDELAANVRSAAAHARQAPGRGAGATPAEHDAWSYRGAAWFRMGGCLPAAEVAEAWHDRSTGNSRGTP